MKTFYRLQNRLRRIPYINSGGCLFAAFAMYNHLKKYYPESQPSIGFYCPNSTYLEDVKDFNNGAIRCPLCYHCYVIHTVNGERVYEDTTGVKEFKGAPVHELDLTRIDALLEKMNDPYEWNSAFDRRYIDKILHLGELPDLDNLEMWETIVAQVQKSN